MEQIQNKKPSMVLNENSINTDGLKLVKGAFVLYQRDTIFVKHIKTVIFAYSPLSGLAEVNKGKSNTSDRQIKTALEFFNVLPGNVVNVSDGRKWDDVK